MPRLEVVYRPVFWAHTLLYEIALTPALAVAHQRWSATELIDLAFALETRIGNLAEVAREIDEHIRVLTAELDAQPDLESHVTQGRAFRVFDENALRRTILGLNMLLIEMRSCFESLAQFYREFLRHYFDDAISMAESCDHVAARVAVVGWADRLRATRKDMVHKRSPWLRFELEMDPRRYEVVLILEYRLNAASNAEDEVRLSYLKETQQHLDTALESIRDELIRRVRTMR